MTTRQQILEAAERQIRAKGLARVTTRDIARDAGFADGTLFVHFAGKEELVTAVIAAHVPSLVAALEMPAGSATSVAAHLEAIAQAALSFYDHVLPLAAGALGDLVLLERLRQRLRTKSVGPLQAHEYIVAYLQAEQRAGRVPGEVDMVGAALLLLGACFQYAFLQQFLGETPFGQDAATTATALVRTLMAGWPTEKENSP